MAETTLDQLAASISRRAGQYAAGVASAGSTTTLTDTTNLIQPDNSWNNCYVRILSGTYAGQERLISANVQATGILTFTPALAGAIVSGVTYEISPWQRADIAQAAQDAIRAAGNAWMQIKESSVTFTQTQQYALPADVVAVLAVMVYSSQTSAVTGVWDALQDWTITGVPGARKLMLRTWNALTGSYAGTIRYLAMPTLLASAANTLGLGEIVERDALAFVQEYALHVLHEILMARNVTGEMARAHLTLANSHRAKAQEMKAMRDVRREPRQMQGWRVGSQI